MSSTREKKAPPRLWSGSGTRTGPSAIQPFSPSDGQEFSLENIGSSGYGVMEALPSDLSDIMSSFLTVGDVNVDPPLATVPSKVRVRVALLESTASRQGYDMDLFSGVSVSVLMASADAVDRLVPLVPRAKLAELFNKLRPQRLLNGSASESNDAGAQEEVHDERLLPALLSFRAAVGGPTGKLWGDRLSSKDTFLAPFDDDKEYTPEDDEDFDPALDSSGTMTRGVSVRLFAKFLIAQKVLLEVRQAVGGPRGAQWADRTSELGELLAPFDPEDAGGLSERHTGVLLSFGADFHLLRDSSKEYTEPGRRWGDRTSSRNYGLVAPYDERNVSALRTDFLSALLMNIKPILAFRSKDIDRTRPGHRWLDRTSGNKNLLSPTGQEVSVRDLVKLAEGTKWS